MAYSREAGRRTNAFHVSLSARIVRTVFFGEGTLIAIQWHGQSAAIAPSLPGARCRGHDDDCKNAQA